MIRRWMGNRHGRKGFTLLELLISLAASSLLLAILSQTLGAVQLAAQRAMKADAVGDELERGRQMVAELLKAALPPAAGDDDAGFVGRSDSIEFTAAPPNSLSQLGPLRLRLLVAPMGISQLGLFAEVRAAPSARNRVPAIRRDLLIGGLQSVELAYWAELSQGLSNRWSEPGKLPAMVRVRWRIAGEDAEREPVIVAIRRNQSDGCLIDPISMSCRSSDAR